MEAEARAVDPLGGKREVSERRQLPRADLRLDSGRVLSTPPARRRPRWSPRPSRGSQPIVIFTRSMIDLWPRHCELRLIPWIIGRWALARVGQITPKATRHRAIHLPSRSRSTAAAQPVLPFGLATMHRSNVLGAVTASLGHRIRVVVFDVGETLVDETRAWSERADAVGVTRLTLFAALGALIERGQDHRGIWSLLGVERPSHSVEIRREDFYPDAISCMQALVATGLKVGLAGNQPAGTAAALSQLGLPVAFIASSARWGVEKPSPEFFARVVHETGARPREIAYVGDRLDNDVLPARRAGMFAVFLRRGPWGHLHAHRPEVASAHARIESLDELPALFGA